MKKLLTLIALLLAVGFRPVDKPAYQFYDRRGNPADYDKLLRRAAKADVVLFGEIHNNTLCHWLQLQLAKDLLERQDGRVVFGAEMFEADNQVVLDEFLSGKIQERHLTSEAKMWNNYATDYAPLVALAAERGVPFVATNVPRRYASMVARQGWEALDSLDSAAYAWMAPRPVTVDYELPGYQKMLGMMEHGHGGGKDDMARRFVKAQALKDATMAHFIAQNRPEGHVFLHFNGSYHSDGFEGIGWYLREANDQLDVLTISTVEQESIAQLDSASVGVADFVLALPADMIKSYRAN